MHMAEVWIKWGKGLSRRREISVLARKLNISRREAACACMEMWEWADQETTDGHIRGATRDDIDLLLGLPGFGSALESDEVGWLRSTERGITFPRWERHNGKTAKLRALEQRKKKRQRDLEKDKPTRKRPVACPDARGTREREREENSGSSNNPSPERNGSKPKPKPRARTSGVFVDISAEVLCDTGQMRRWFDHESKRRDGWVKGSDAEWVNVQAAAAKALSAEDVADVVALFKWLVKGAHWDRLSDANDDLAAAMRRAINGLAETKAIKD
jgi:hypothetical protein